MFRDPETGADRCLMPLGDEESIFYRFRKGSRGLFNIGASCYVTTRSSFDYKSVERLAKKSLLKRMEGEYDLAEPAITQIVTSAPRQSS